MPDEQNQGAGPGAEEELDFSGLDDEQVILLLRDVLGEALRRGPATGAAARDLFLDAAAFAQAAHAAADREAERLRQAHTARVAHEAAQRVQAETAAEREAKVWAVRKGVALAAEELFGTRCKFDAKKLEIAVWKRSGGTERRLYVQRGFNDKLVTFHITGSSARNLTPGKLELARDPDMKAHRAVIKAFCEAVAALWMEAKLDIGAALAWTGPATPFVYDKSAMPPAPEPKPAAAPAAAPSAETPPSSAAPPEAAA
jgi:hypothetical protein